MKDFGYLLLGTLLSGCVAVRSDLSAPAERTLLGGEPVVVARDGTVLPVVTDDSPQNRWAAIFLADTIEEAFGKRPKIIVEKDGEAAGIRLGEVGSRSRTEELANSAVRLGLGSSSDAFRVIAKDGCVRFEGRADFAVFDWCERELGMRYYCPAGKCVEPREEIVVEPVDYADRPVFAHRTISGKSAWARVAKSGSTHRGGVHVHAPHAWGRDAKLRAAHPEIFENDKTPMLCYGNPATLDYYKARIDRHIAGLEDSGGIVNTNRKVVTVCQWDAPVRCDCSWCRTLYDYAGEARGKASPVLWGWFLPQLADWLKAAHPDYLISFLPYLNTVGVTKTWGRGGEVEKWRGGNCEAEVCTMPGMAMLKDETVREREEGILRGWQAVTGRKVLGWNYGCWPRDFTSAPYVFGRTAQRHCAAMRDVLAGTFICGGEGDPRIALSMYVWMKCLWNPDIDVEAVYDGFARRMFGPAAKPMRELIALQEDCWERPWKTETCTYENVFETSFPPADVARMKALLDEARQIAEAAKDVRAAARVRWYASGFRRFLKESEILAQRHGGTEIGVGETREMVLARSTSGTPWAKTTVTFDGTKFVVRCEEPAANKMDWTSIDNDFVWGDDCVTFVFEGLGVWNVYKTGKVERWRGGEVKKWRGGEVEKWRVTHDGSGWTVEMGVPDEAVKRGFVRGNVCRWRVGDRREPKEGRVKGSRYEHSRLGTVFTRPDDDPAAFVTFRLKK